MTSLIDKCRQVTADDLIFFFVALTFLFLPTGTAPPLIAISIAGLVWIFSGRVLKTVAIVKEPWFWPVIPMILLPWLGLLHSDNLGLGLDYALKTKYWLAVLILASIQFSDRECRIAVTCLLFSLTLGAVMAIFQFYNLLPLGLRPYFGFGIVHTLIHTYLIIGILMVSFYFQKARAGWQRAGLLLMTVAFIFHLSVMNGRAGYLIFGLLSPLIAANFMHRFPVKVKAVLAVLMVCLLLLSPVVRQTVCSSYENLCQNKDKILQGEYVAEFPRLFIIKEAFESMKSHPIVGVGTSGLSESTRAKGHPVNHPHSTILHMGICFGIPGLLTVAWIFITLFRRAFRERRTDTGFFLLSAASVLFLGGLFDTQVLNTGPLLLFALSYGMLHHLPGKHKHRR